MKTKKQPSAQRLEILNKIKLLEQQRRFDEDVEPDPPAPPLLPEDIDYLHKGFWGNCCRLMAFGGAYCYFWYLEWRKLIKVNRARGLEHLQNAQGAVITYPNLMILDFSGSGDDFQVSEEEVNIGISVRDGNKTLLDAMNKVLDPMSADDFNAMMAQAVAIQPIEE